MSDRADVAAGIGLQQFQESRATVFRPELRNDNRTERSALSWKRRNDVNSAH